MTVQQINASVIKQVQQASSLFLKIGLTMSVYRAQQACEQEQQTRALFLRTGLTFSVYLEQQA